MTVRTAAAANATTSDRTDHARPAVGSAPARPPDGMTTTAPTANAAAHPAAARNWPNETVPLLVNRLRPYTVSPTGTATASPTAKGTPQRPRPLRRRDAQAAATATSSRAAVKLS